MSIYSLLSPIYDRIKMILNRSLLSRVNDETPIQTCQISIMRDEVKDGVERVQDYGFTSNPNEGAEALVGFINGNKDQGIIIKIDDSRVRLKPLEKGEVAIYNDKGAYVKLNKDGDIEIKSKKVIYTVDAVELTADKIELGGSPLLATAGVVTGECLDPVTGVPFPDKSAVVFAKKVGT